MTESQQETITKTAKRCIAGGHTTACGVVAKLYLGGGVQTARERMMVFWDEIGGVTKRRSVEALVEAEVCDAFRDALYKEEEEEGMTTQRRIHPQMICNKKARRGVKASGHW